MKNKLNWFLAAGIALTTGISFGQKSMETTAAVEFKNTFLPAFASGDMAKAKASIKKARIAIDQAAANPDTKESPKTLYLKGEIYYYLMFMRSMDSVEFADITEAAFDESMASFNKSYTISSKFKSDIEESIMQKKGQLDQIGVKAFNDKKYNDAMEVYDTQVKLSAAINRLDTTSIYYAGVCAANAENWDKAATYYAKCADYGYKVPEIYKMVANAYIQGKKQQEATAYLQKAIEKTPNDKELHYVIGTFYMEAGDNEKATESLRRAVAIDPKFWDAQYQLGAHLQSQGTAIRTKANALPYGDKNFDKLIAESDEYYRQALVPLEAYIAANPNDKAVLQSLAQLHRALKNTEKAIEYKKRLDEAK